jgi:glycosyltransferase involved in cell wall biosynthesis
MIVGTDMSHDARVWKEATTLANHGHSVVVLAAHNDALEAEEHRSGVHVVRVVPSDRGGLPWPDLSPGSSTTETAPPRARRKWLGLRGLRGALWKVRLDLQILKWIRRLDPDVLHIHDADRLFIGWCAHKIIRKPFVYDSHEYFAGLLTTNSWRGYFQQRVWTALERLCIGSASRVITVNSEIANKLCHRYGLNSVTAIHNFPSSRTAEPTRTNLLRSMLPAPYRDKPLLLYQGRLTAHRGIEEFIEVVSRLPGVAAAIVGSGPNESTLKAIAADKRLHDRLVFVPQVPWNKLCEYTADADVGFCLSQDDCENNRLALPNKIFEYLMAGVPVVVSDFPILREYVDKSGVGVLAPQDNPATIAEIVGALLAEPRRLDEMKERALQLSRLTFNWESQEAELIRLYSSFEPLVRAKTHRTETSLNTKNPPQCEAAISSTDSAANHAATVRTVDLRTSSSLAGTESPSS